jgi:hypothetical protein
VRQPGDRRATLPQRAGSRLTKRQQRCVPFRACDVGLEGIVSKRSSTKAAISVFIFNLHRVEARALRNEVKRCTSNFYRLVLQSRCCQWTTGRRSNTAAGPFGASEVSSLQVGAVSCSIREGNVFGQ